VRSIRIVTAALTGLATLLLLFGAASASASVYGAPRLGHWKGQTRSGGQITFKAIRRHHRFWVKGFTARIPYYCQLAQQDPNDPYADVQYGPASLAGEMTLAPARQIRLFTGSFGASWGFRNTVLITGSAPGVSGPISFAFGGEFKVGPRANAPPAKRVSGIISGDFYRDNGDYCGPAIENDPDAGPTVNTELDWKAHR
jgi:hypothetical protein